MNPRRTGSTMESGAAHASLSGPARTVSVASAYRALALLLFNTLLLFALVNLALGGFFYVRDRSKGRLPRPQPVGSPKYPKELYPHMREKERRAMLIETRRLSFELEPLTHYRERTSKGKYVNVAAGGFRVNRRRGPWPPDPHAFTIFFFGGSTTFGYGVRDDDTIPSVLQDLLSQGTCQTPVYVYNFGRGAYYSAQERGLLAQLLVEGFTPHVAIFLDGINEFLTARQLLPLEPKSRAAPDYRLFSMKLEIPLLRAARAAGARLDRIRGPNPLRGSDAGRKAETEAQKDIPARTVLSQYLRNMALTEAMAAHFGVETLFVWQPVPAYGYDLRYHLFPPSDMEVVRYGYSEFNRLMARLPAHEQKRLVWLGDLQRTKKEPLYVDEWHYTAAFSREIAEQIAQALVSRNLVCRVRASLTERK